MKIKVEYICKSIQDKRLKRCVPSDKKQDDYFELKRMKSGKLVPMYFSFDFLKVCNPLFERWMGGKKFHERPS